MVNIGKILRLFPKGRTRRQKREAVEALFMLGDVLGDIATFMAFHFDSGRLRQAAGGTP